MKQFKYLLLLLLTPALGCSDIYNGDPYEDQLQTLGVQLVYPGEYEQYRREGVDVKIEETQRGYSYTVRTDASGRVDVQLARGFYRVMVGDKIDGNIFNGMSDRVKLIDSDVDLDLGLIHSVSGSIIIKEIYCGGVTKAPLEGNYQSDKYIILHNNDSRVQYLDSLCFGTFDPYNSQGTNVWVGRNPQTGETVFPDFVPVAQAIWQIGGDGTTFPLRPGEDAVLVVCGAVDHAARYPGSVNLNKKDYFVCYNPVYFWNTLYHPAPGDKISPERYLNVVIKTGQANAFTFSVFSPATVIFKAKDTTIQDFILGQGNVVQKPGSTADRIVKVPLDWVLDGVEVFYGGSSNNKKRIPPGIDAGYAVQTALYDGRTLHRHVDAKASAQAGYEVLVDTNNSSGDFYERAQQSLHD